MDEMMNESTFDQDGTGTEEKIECKRCGEFKERKEFRNVTNPGICLECYLRARRKSNEDTQTSDSLDVKASKSTSYKAGDGPKKQSRATLHLSTHAQSVLTVLSLRAKTSQSKVVEDMLTQRYEAMASTEKQFVRYVEESSLNPK